MRLLSAVMAAGFILTSVGISAGEPADAPMVRASCVQGSNVVYREDFPASGSSAKRVLIAAAHPDAMCIFLDVPTAPVKGSGPQVLPGNILEAAMGGNVIADNGLAAALSIIAGGDIGQPYPRDFATAIAGNTKDDPEINLTVGVYRGVPVADVMEHWKLMQKDTKVLSALTPTVNSVGEITVVSVEGVPDELAVLVCEEASVLGPGCIAAY